MKKSYYYECTHCGDILERSQEFASQAFTNLFCYRCGCCRTVRRLICRTTGFVLLPLRMLSHSAEGDLPDHLHVEG
jgi:predicted nucleic acid-binding Zn ribbon protein